MTRVSILCIIIITIKLDTLNFINIQILAMTNREEKLSFKMRAFFASGSMTSENEVALHRECR